jgi:hypothetical protein
MSVQSASALAGRRFLLITAVLIRCAAKNFLSDENSGIRPNNDKFPNDIAMFGLELSRDRSLEWNIKRA